MEGLEWNEKISLNNQQIDDHHKKLFALVNKLKHVTDDQVNSSIVSDTLFELINYTRYHFKNEERLMEEVAYPHIEEHKQKHISFLRKVALLSNEAVEGDEGVLAKIYMFLNQWLVQHISVEDQDYKNYIKETPR